MRVTKRGTDDVSFFLLIIMESQIKWIWGVNILCQKIGEMVPDRSLYLVVSKKVCKFSLSFFVFYSLFFLLFPESLLIHIPRICCFGFFHRNTCKK